MINPGALSIYIVDDDKMFTSALARQLERSFRSASLNTFTTGEQFLKEMKSCPDILILDYYLSSKNTSTMNGLEVLKWIRKIYPGTKVIMLSAQDKIDVALETIRNGAQDYVIKDDNVFLQIKLVIMNALQLMDPEVESHEEAAE